MITNNKPSPAYDNTAKKDEKQTIVMEQADVLYNLIDQVTTELKILEEALNPILAPDRPEVACASTSEQVIEVPFALTLQSRNSTLEQQLYILRNIIQRISI